MITLVFMLEERSAEVLLKSLLPRILPDGVHVIYIVHEGKQDLEKSLPIKLKCWNIPNSWFVVLRDKDQSDCVKLKNRLKSLCSENRRPETLVRIVVHELESWFLGDLAAIEQAFNLPNITGKQQSRKFRNPDALANAQQELKKLVSGYQKVAGARQIAPYLSIENNTSTSFQQCISGLKKYLEHIENETGQPVTSA